MQFEEHHVKCGCVWCKVQDVYSQGQAAARVVTNCSVHNTNKSEITSEGAGVVRWHLVRRTP